MSGCPLAGPGPVAAAPAGQLRAERNRTALGRAPPGRCRPPQPPALGSRGRLRLGPPGLPSAGTGPTGRKGQEPGAARGEGSGAQSRAVPGEAAWGPVRPGTAPCSPLRYGLVRPGTAAQLASFSPRAPRGRAGELRVPFSPPRPALSCRPLRVLRQFWVFSPFSLFFSMGAAAPARRKAWERRGGPNHRAGGSGGGERAVPLPPRAGGWCWRGRAGAHVGPEGESKCGGGAGRGPATSLPPSGLPGKGRAGAQGAGWAVPPHPLRGGRGRRCGDGGGRAVAAPHSAGGGSAFGCAPPAR